MSLPLLITPSDHHIDTQWYEKLVGIAGVANEIYTILGPSPASLGALEIAFMESGFTHNPSLLPDGSSNAVVTGTKEQLKQLLQEIKATEQNNLVTQAYEKRISEFIDNLDLLQAAETNNASAFTQKNVAIYGLPDKAVFYATCSWFRKAAERTLQENPADPAARKVLDLLPDQPSSVQLLPQTSLFEVVKNNHWEENGFYAQLFAGISLPDTPTISQEVGDQIVRQALQNIGANDYALADSPNEFWGVRTSPKTVVHPRAYELSIAEFIGVVGHEVGSHVIERINGHRQPLQLLGSGLDKFEAGNEGRALLREQVAYDSPAAFEVTTRWQDILRRHLSISLAIGLDRGSPRSFAETYNIVHAVDTVLAQDPSADVHHRTWTLLSRSLKGTDGTGGAYYKDIVYLEGNIRCWQVANHNPAMILYGDRGKFDITRPEHITLLQALKILPENL